MGVFLRRLRGPPVLRRCQGRDGLFGSLDTAVAQEIVMLDKRTLKELNAALKTMLQGRGVMEVDIANLEREWAGQAERHMLIGLIIAHYRKRKEDAKANLEFAKARAAKLIRQRPDKWGVDGRLTDQMAKENVPLHKLYKEANDRLIQAEFELDQVEAVYKASDHRKKALEEEDSLWALGYFAKPSAKRTKHEKVRQRSRTRDEL